MHEYTVLNVARCGSEYSLWLYDSAGKHHLARATAAVPDIGTTLLGSSPALGFGLLVGATLDEVYRVIFEAVHCTQAEAHQSVHASLAA